MQCHECHRIIADNATFCPYCGKPVEREQQKRGERRKRHRNTREGHSRHRIPRPVLVVAVVIVAFVGFISIFGGGGSQNAGNRDAAPTSTRPDPFEGHIQFLIEDRLVVDFTVKDMWAILSLDDTVGGVMDLIAGLTPNSTEAGSGVFDYELAHVNINEDSYAMEGFPAVAELAVGDGPTRTQCIDALTNVRAQIIIPTDAMQGQIAGTWGIRYEQGGLPIRDALLPADDAPVYTELLLTINADGTFVLESVACLPSDEHPKLDDAPKVEYTVTGDWWGPDVSNVTFQAETLRVVRDGVSEAESSLLGIIPPMYAGLNVSDASGPEDVPTEVEVDEAGAPEEQTGEPSGSDGAETELSPDAELEGQPADNGTGGQPEVDISAITDWAFVESARLGLGVPNYISYTFEVGDPYYREGIGMTVTPITFYQDGYVIASAECDEDGTPLSNMLPYTGDRY